MKVLVDEDLPPALVDLLVEFGYDAEHVAGAGLRGKTDREVHLAAIEREALLLSADLGFGNRAHYSPQHGIVLLRFPEHFRRSEILTLARRFLQSVDLASFADALVVVSPGHYRVRR